MPETTEITVKAAELKAGDQLVSFLQPQDVKAGKQAVKQIHENLRLQVFVTSKNIATKLTHVETGIGKISLETGSDVIVRREVKTEAEKKAEADAYTAQMFERFVVDAKASANVDVMQWLNEKVASYVNDVPSGLSWYTEDALVMGHRKAFAAKFLAMLDNDAAQDEPVGPYEVFLAWCESLERELLQMARSMSRSTNPVSNLSNDCKMKAAGSYLEDFADTRWLRSRILDAKKEA
jgi:hypothetical protein